MDKPSHGLNRRELMGTAAAAGLAAGGGLGEAWTVSATPAVSVHLDVPYVDVHGRGQAYRPPVRSAIDAGLVDPHELV